MSRTGLKKLAIAAAAIAASAVGAHAYDVEEVGSFYIGGKPVTLSGIPEQEVKSPGEAPQKVDINGDYHTGQMYAQFVRLAHPAAKYPLLMWHTGGITGASWETKPDGNPGWQQFFLKQGHSVYVSDAVERGRASFSRPEIYKSDPVFRDKRDGWEIFRIGPPGSYRTNPADRKAFPGVKFDLSSYDTLQMEAVARWPNTGEATQAAYNQLVQKACPCVIMAHGQAGHFAMYAALANPDKVKALIAIEPAFAPAPDNPAIARLKNTPHLYVWGDFLDANPTWVGHVKGIRPYYDALTANGVPATWMDLPTEGIRGNTHMIMMDTNSDVVAARVQAWMSKNGLMNSAAVASAHSAPPAAGAAYAKTPAKKLAKVVNARARRSNLGAGSLIPAAGQAAKSGN
ncbi:MAG: esterase [Proteobacteria bacterium]|nr:esterase [Pseudomonadota bacterium]